ncbi:hypothetical protein K402DRAFT_412372 [Aulographum hederae CBS 113979]|uniref:Uncharacterized protein n=1 Tax=Aulographum hederae CBS 113979 TaxID=1176131 RepID=A0A6G1H1X8_9PEZI|nr:hypothetical protein K402DRAFT_412372 [Aulographum hederae CBS 113979]
MPPDLNSVPPSPRPDAAVPATASASAATSRRASQIFPMGPPPLPLATPGGGGMTASASAPIPASHNQQSPNHSTQTQATQPFPPFSMGERSGESVAVPMRHPRPLTTAELHLELEKEQEAVVNRLTRELSSLRAHSASVASTTSQSSSSTAPMQSAPTSLLETVEGGISHPTPSRRHRSSSSVSRGSIGAGGAGYFQGMGATAARQQRGSVVGGNSSDHSASATASTSMRSPNWGFSTPRYEETAQHRMELEEAKEENRMLRERVRELEALVRGRRGREGGREGSAVSAAGGGGSAGGAEEG